MRWFDKAGLVLLTAAVMSVSSVKIASAYWLSGHGGILWWLYR
jgi:hypothetical protein